MENGREKLAPFLPYFHCGKSNHCLRVGWQPAPLGEYLGNSGEIVAAISQERKSLGGYDQRLIFAIGVAAGAVANVANVFILMFLNHLLLVVAVEASVVWGWARVAGGAFGVGVAVIEGKGMIEGGPFPGFGVVAV